MSTPLPILIFDGDCGFCTTSARAAQRWFSLANVEPWQFVDLDALGLTAEECDEAVQWVAEDGTISAAQYAAIEALRSGGRIGRTLGWLMALPGIHRLAGVVYRFVARHRDRMPGGTPACKLPRS